MQFVHLIESFEVISSLATLKRSDAEQRGQLAWKTFSPAAAAPPALLPVPAPPPAPLPVGGGPLGGGGSTLNLAAHAGHAKAVGTVGTTTRSWLVHEGHWTRHVGGGGVAGGAGGSAEPRGAGNLASSSSSDLPEANRRHQRPSEVIGKSSEVIRGHQRSSEAIRGHWKVIKRPRARRATYSRAETLRGAPSVRWPQTPSGWPCSAESSPAATACE